MAQDESKAEEPNSNVESDKEAKKIAFPIVVPIKHTKNGSKEDELNYIYVGSVHSVNTELLLLDNHGFESLHHFWLVNFGILHHK